MVKKFRFKERPQQWHKGWIYLQNKISTFASNQPVENTEAISARTGRLEDREYGVFLIFTNFDFCSAPRPCGLA